MDTFVHLEKLQYLASSFAWLLDFKRWDKCSDKYVKVPPPALSLHVTGLNLPEWKLGPSERPETLFRIKACIMSPLPQPFLAEHFLFKSRGQLHKGVWIRQSSQWAKLGYASKFSFFKMLQRISKEHAKELLLKRGSISRVSEVVFQSLNAMESYLEFVYTDSYYTQT